jgi:uncharacterized protein YkwD
MTRIIRIASMGFALLLSTATGCDKEDESIEQHSEESAACVAQINAYRETLGLTPYARWSEGEACASKQARQDATSGDFHGSFRQCDEMAQNECLGSGPIESMLDTCLQDMWNEGPGEDYKAHGHYLAMSSTDYTEVACGYFVKSSGEVWSVQNFR